MPCEEESLNIFSFLPKEIPLPSFVLMMQKTDLEITQGSAPSSSAEVGLALFICN